MNEDYEAAQLIKSEIDRLKVAIAPDYVFKPKEEQQQTLPKEEVYKFEQEKNYENKKIDNYDERIIPTSTDFLKI